MSDTEHVHIAVIGTGFSGIAMAVRLQEDGVEDFVLLERAAAVGGTWRDNSYPGCACDVPSHLYSLSFELNPAWRSTFSSQEEIWDYLRGCAERYGVLPHVRFDHEVLEATWWEDQQRWRIETSQGALTADVLVSATGGLSEPSVPACPASRRSPGRRSTPPAGITTTTSPAGASRSSARAPRRSSSCPGSSRRSPR